MTAGAGPRGTATSTPTDIVEHLRYLLNTRIGEAPTALGYGVEDLSDLCTQFPDAAEIWRRSIQETIERYEPRLTKVRVRHRPNSDPLIVTFEITAQVVVGEDKSPITLKTQVDSTGIFLVW